MTIVIGKQFEDRPDYWEGRYISIRSALLTIDSAGISLDQEAIAKMSPEKRVLHLETIALEATKYEWEICAK
jgi:hypothetical protein